ncbi:unnamed protein product [Bursaphelenchus okinawaensis]|uniref:Myelin regulatory factor n=1 Tax=Bursaphelenchus okinawaensis TaxID=465554 RepID=A0A811KHI5_9BILA|nr:unnamed protein product [Bursaphelenchus okinawaensis]CAG9103020.1 unnamed protein product [Bursaphelenchus okinawaensis]
MASQRYQLKDETGYGDPLGDCDNFNLLAFINSNGDTPADSPAPGYPQQYQAQHQQQFMMQQQQQQQQQQMRQVQQPVCLDNVMLAAGYPQSTQSRLPDSPPITDISAGASSGSPSSDAPYSPDQYAQYQYQQQQQRQNNNMMNNRMGQMHIQDPNMMRQPLQQTQVSPNSDYMSYPSHTPPSQLSPQQLNQRNQNFLQQQQQYSMDMYLNENDATDFSDIIDNPNVRAGQKRRRYDGPLTQIKNEQMIHPAQTPMPMGHMMNSSSSSPHSGSVEEFDEGPHHRTIKFSPFDPNNWAPLYDERRQPMAHPLVNVIADKGFNFVQPDNCFVNQKKNHFQITCHVEVKERPAYVCIDKQLKPIRRLKMMFCGVKSEMTSSEIPIRQSQTDRKPIKHDGEEMILEPHKLAKKTVPRLHFSETTLNNHRKSGKPNPDQKYFLLVVKFVAEVDNGYVMMQGYASDKVIVRASNPGQFENQENDVGWQKTSNTLHFNGQVAIGTDRPLDNAQLSVMGNLVATGNVTRPSDRRVKENIVPVDTRDAIENINKMRIVEYSYKPELAEQWGLSEKDRHRVGVIAQELAEVLPDAVKENGELYTVDETRIFYEGFAAAQELSRLYGHLDGRVDKVQQIAELLAKDARRRKKLGASMASGLSGLTQLVGKEEEQKLGESSKFLSQSQLSITSSTPSIDASQIGSASQVGYRGYKKYRKGSARDPPLCGSKMTQFTMIALVFIMSMCLVTMCTLYVLDWYNRTYVYTPHSFPRNPPTTPPMLMDNIIDLTNKEWSPPEQDLIHPLLASCALGGMNCPIYCCASPSAYNMSETEDGVDGFVALAKPEGKVQERMSAVISNDSGKLKPFGSGVEIKLTDLNVTLDERFCVEGSCAPRKGRYNLYVPISGYMPTISLHVKLTVPKGMFVDNCGALKGFKHKSCEFETADEETVAQPDMFKMDSTTFQITAGEFMQSAYRFRVGHSTMSCQMSEDQQGRSFDEFNLVFYRKCV